MMNSTLTSIESNFFNGFYKWDAIKIVHLSFQAILSLIAPVLLYLVVAYEHSLNNRLLTNQLLSHFCCINFISFFTTRIIFLISFYFGPSSALFCDITIQSGRFFFLLALGELALWQTVKYLQKFTPRYLLIINDDFFALFLTNLNIFLNVIHAVVAYTNRLQNSSLDYHICIGRNPNENAFLKLENNQNNSTDASAKESYIAPYTLCLSLALLASAALFWLLSLKQKVNPELSENDSEETMLGAGGSLILVCMIVSLIIPLFVPPEYAKDDPQSINSGAGKAWVYIRRITLPILSYCIVPITILVINPNLRKFSVRKMKEVFKI